MKLLRLSIFFIISLVAMTNAIAQEYRFAHLDFQRLLNDYPGKLEAEERLADETQKLKDQLSVMNAELEQKYRDYVSKRDSLPDLVRNTIEKDIQDTQQRIDQFREMAMQSITQKEQRLLQPVIKKIMNAIEQVRKEHDFIYIFDTSSKVILSVSDLSYDAEPLVRTKLGMD
ncbi:MAG: OmpH family outer membrane protein [Marinilabiliaceae bacterium]|nr:OmpH family outer membrane protein [Marinilabiliaceae bacterium]